MKKSNLLYIDSRQACGKIEQFIRSYALSLDRGGAVVGLSGGLDSSVVLKLCANALGRKRVTAVLLPERDSSSTHTGYAVSLCRKLGVDYILKKITLPLWVLGVYRLFPPAFLFPKSAIRKYVKKEWDKTAGRLNEDLYMVNLQGSSDPLMARSLAYIRIKNRLRSSVLFYYSELNNYLLAGTANKSEWMTGFFVKFGDNTADIMPLSGLYKTQIKEIAKYLGIPEKIISKEPSPDLAAGLTDRDILNMPYSQLDMVLAGIENNLTFTQIAEIANTTAGDVQRVSDIIYKSEWLRQPPVNLKI
ncbi:MAG: NAD(+) synthase [Actinomycetota bacterium]